MHSPRTRAAIVPTLGTTVCDLIPAGTTLIPNTPQVKIGSGSANPSGETFTPLAPLPDNNSCLDQRNPDGAVIFNLGDVTNTPSSNVGFVRLRVRVN
ncbi:MAG: hypothetical protein HC866_06485 [Leptolyngbyaceae cyanobacterium RU_5_1]|nr:hypothetical protein [Leptolyngbyaceae cyanobacterium RU_5_1]